MAMKMPREFDQHEGGGPGRAVVPWWGRIIAIALVWAVGYGAYFWLVRRVVVGADQVLVLMKKDGTKSLPADQVIIPRPPAAGTAEYAQWEKQYGECNGIMEQVYLPGVYFGFSPFDYEREVIPLGDANVPQNKVGVVVRKFGQKLPTDAHGAVQQVLADESASQRGPLAKVLQPGKCYEYANPHAYQIKLVDPITIEPGHRGVATIVAGSKAREPNQFLVEDGEQGVQKKAETEGFMYVNPFVKRITSVSIQSQRFEMVGADAIRFPSADSFDIKMEGFVEWSIIPDELPLRYVQYGEGGALIPLIEERVILPYARSFCRTVGSQYTARDFISGDTKLKFQAEFERQLREACRKEAGIEVLQALVRDIVPPDAIKDPINEREIAKQQIRSLEQQIQVAKSAADLATQTEMANQNQKIGEANKQVVTIVKKAEQERDVALTKAKQELEVAKLHLDAAQKQGDAIFAKGQAESQVILMQKQAEADPLRQQVAAFGDGQAFAQYFFYQRVAPSIKSILTNTDGPFADLFKQFMKPAATAKPIDSTVSHTDQRRDQP